MPVIEVSHLNKCFGRTVAVADVSFEVQRGEIFGVLGPNGAGKTTTVECVGGLRQPDGGSLRVLGLDPHRDRDRIRRLVGMQLQDSQLPGRITTAEAMQLYASFYHDPEDWRILLEQLALAKFAGTEYRRLSGGTRQRLSVALALIGRPKVAILDELTTGLDPRARLEIWELIEQIRARGVTVLLVTHLMEEAERLCDRLVIVNAGRVAASGTPAELVSQAGAVHRVRFRPSRPIDDLQLLGLPEVTKVETIGGTSLVVTGTSDLLAAVTSMLARLQIVAMDLRYEQASLDEAFLAITSQDLTESTAAKTSRS